MFKVKDSQEEGATVLNTLSGFKQSVVSVFNNDKSKIDSGAFKLVERFLKRRQQMNAKKAGAKAVDIEDVVDDNFPSEQAVEAFLHPQIIEPERFQIGTHVNDTSSDRKIILKWSKPDVERIKVLCFNLFSLFFLIVQCHKLSV